MGADQTERAYQKQSNVFLNRKGGLKASESRWHCNPGLGFKIPMEAKLGNYIDNNVSIHISPCFRDVSVGDIATVGECRPLSKTVKFNTLKVTGTSKVKKSFAKF